MRKIITQSNLYSSSIDVPNTTAPVCDKTNLLTMKVPVDMAMKARYFKEV